MSIPKILHCIWIWELPAPMKWINSWKTKHPDWKYILWTNKELNEKAWINQKAINYYKSIWKWNWVADIMRYEILYDYWWVLHPADSECLNSIDYLFIDWAYSIDTSTRWDRPARKENIGACMPLIACEKNSKVAKELIEMIWEITEYKSPAKTTWNRLMQKYVNNNPWKITILPLYHFMPEHYDWRKYTWKGKVYARHYWWTTRKTYNQWI